MLLSGFEPELTVPKTIVLSITPQKHFNLSTFYNLKVDKFFINSNLVLEQGSCPQFQCHHCKHSMLPIQSWLRCLYSRSETDNRTGYLLFHKLLYILRKIKITAKLADYMERRAEKNTAKVENLMFLGLMLFVAIPLPGTGAWTASMIAGLTKMPLKKAIPPIILGVVIAAGIVTVLYYCFRELFEIIV